MAKKAAPKPKVRKPNEQYRAAQKNTTAHRRKPKRK